MKTIIRTAAATTLVSALFASQAFAMTATGASVQESLNSAHLDSRALYVSVRDGVVTLSGSVNDNLTRVRAERVAQKSDGVTDVVNLITGN